MVDDYPRFPARYTPLRVLGSGGQSNVYEAQDSVLVRRVALKITHTLSTESCARLKKEYQSLSKVDSPFVCKVYEVAFTEDNRPFIAMELVLGTTLEQNIEEHADLVSCESFIRHLIKQMAQALMEIHALGFIHRDLKPANIMILGDNQTAKLVDFGLIREENALLTSSSALVASLAYMSPEHAHPRMIDARSDIFSLGSVLYECATGTTPFVADSPMQLFLNMKTGCPSLSKTRLSPALQRIIEKCLAYEPERRFQSAKELLDILDSADDLSAMQTCQNLSPGVVAARAPFCIAFLALAALFYFTATHAEHSTSNIIGEYSAKGTEEIAKLKELQSQNDTQGLTKQLLRLQQESISDREKKNILSKSVAAMDRLSTLYQNAGDVKAAKRWNSLAMQQNQLNQLAKTGRQIRDIDLTFMLGQATESDLKRLDGLNRSFNQSSDSDEAQEQLMQIAVLQARLSSLFSNNADQLRLYRAAVWRQKERRSQNCALASNLRYAYAKLLMENGKDTNETKRALKDLLESLRQQIETKRYLHWSIEIRGPLSLCVSSKLLPAQDYHQIQKAMETVGPAQLETNTSFCFDLQELAELTGRPSRRVEKLLRGTAAGMSPDDACRFYLLLSRVEPRKSRQHLMESLHVDRGGPANMSLDGKITLYCTLGDTAFKEKDFAGAKEFYRKAKSFASQYKAHSEGVDDKCTKTWCQDTICQIEAKLTVSAKQSTRSL